MVVSCMDMARRATGFGTLSRAMTETKGKHCELLASKMVPFRTDHKSFKCGMGCMSFRRYGILGRLTFDLGTRRDDRCDQKNIDWVCSAVTACLQQWAE